MKTKSETAASVRNRVSLWRAEQSRKAPCSRRRAAVSLSALLILGALGGVFHLLSRGEQAYRVLLDVNPSVAVNVSEDGEVLKAEALNPDGQAVLGESQWEGQRVESALESIVGEMVEQGYLNEEKNSVLVSVEGETSASLESSLSQAVEDALAEKKLEGSVLVQELSKATELDALAAQYGISQGKAQLILKMLEQNSLQSFESL
ncbi:MAG: hypothetical protein IKC69_07300, partial [Clostridia bacterium]|nr:hypothetical protein [Clostridia bacterium]